LTIRSSWARTILALSCSAVCLNAQKPRNQADSGSLEALARDFRSERNASNRAALENFLLKHPKDSDGALARLVLFNGDTSAQGRQALAAVRPLLPQLADYVDWMSAATALAASDAQAAQEAAFRVLDANTGVLDSRAVAVIVQAARANNDHGSLQALLARHSRALTSAQRDLYMALSLEWQGNDAAASEKFLKLYLEQPRSAEAQEAASRVVAASVPAERLLDRAVRLLDAGDPGGAKAALGALLSRLNGRYREVAQVKIGVAEYRLRSAAAAGTLQRLSVNDPAADAERLFYLLLAARRAKDYATMAEAVTALNQKHPASTWRFEGLANAGSQYWVMGESARSLPLFEACAAQSKECAWKAAVASHILKRHDASQKLLAYLEQDPAGEHASAALYFLGRAAEDQRDSAAATAYYGQAVDSFPNHFYAEISRERLAQPALTKQIPSPQITARLRNLAFPNQSKELDFHPNASTRRRLDRAQLLAHAALYDLAESELRFEGRAHPQAHILALEAARIATRRGAPDQGIRYIKSIFPAYINLPLSAVTLPLLKLAYPLPYKDELLTHAFKNELDPYVVAGLIRQESEFSSGVVSRSNAHGLMQIMPATGRELARRLSIPGFSRQALFEPLTNIKMGTYYYKRLLDGLSGSWAHALASYNAGGGRVRQWLSRGNLASDHDPAEFVETIPFDETRNYVQAVMRNAGMYRRIYGEAAAPPVSPASIEAPVRLAPKVQAAQPKRVAKPVAKPAATKKKPVRRTAKRRG
jgi:soluble lytic murein transglycosylase